MTAEHRWRHLYNALPGFLKVSRLGDFIFGRYLRSNP